MAVKRNILVGLFTIPVRLEVAIDKEAGDRHAVCTGDGTHEPVRVKTHVDCTFPTCEESHSSAFGYDQRGVVRDNKLVVLTAEEIRGAVGEPIKDLALEFHPRAEFYAATLAGDSVQNIFPEKGGEKGYTALVRALVAHPDKVAVARWAPSTKNATWVIEVVEGRLTASKRADPDVVRGVPAIAEGEVADFEQKMLDATIDALATPFDPAAYTDTGKRAVEELIASRLGTAGTAPAAIGGGAAPTAAVDMFAALQATVDALPKAKPTSVPATAKKAAAKRAPAKKAAARKPAVKVA